MENGYILRLYVPVFRTKLFPCAGLRELDIFFYVKHTYLISKRLHDDCGGHDFENKITRKSACRDIKVQGTHRANQKKTTIYDNS